MDVELLAGIAGALFVALAAFQVVLVFGAPYGHLVYGGRVVEPGESLPSAWRVASALAALILLGFAWVVLARGGVIETGVGDTVLTVLCWMVVAYMAINTAGNLAARHPVERYVLGGITGLLVVLCSIVAAAGPS